MNRIVALRLSILIYFPLISSLLLVIGNFELVIINYLCLFVFAFGFIITKKYVDFKRSDSIRYFIYFSLFYVFTMAINYIARGAGSLYFLGRTYGIFLAVLLIYYSSTFEEYRLEDILRKVSVLIGCVFIIQFFVSVFEALNGVGKDFLSNSYDWNTTRERGAGGIVSGYADIYERLQIKYFFSFLNIPFKTIFSGMLGQHNHWGTQLPFYNLIFLYEYFTTKKKRGFYFLLIIAVFMASVFNTSRFGIMAVMITTIFFMLKFSNLSRFLKISIVLVITSAIAINLMIIISNLVNYISLTDTFSLRLEVWEKVWSQMWGRSLYSVLFGSTLKEVENIRLLLPWQDFESLIFQVIIENGVVTLIFFVITLIIMWSRARNLNPINKYLARFVILNVVFVSLWSNLVFRYSAYGFIALILIRIYVESNKENNDNELSKNGELTNHYYLR